MKVRGDRHKVREGPVDVTAKGLVEVNTASIKKRSKACTVDIGS